MAHGTREQSMKKVLVSACLLGEHCRYDGGSKADPRAMGLGGRFELVPVCPEQLGGLPTPRPRHELRNGRVISEHGDDRTDAFTRGAREALRIALENGCTLAVLKARSPSCGKARIYDGTFTGRIVEGDGVAARLLTDSGIEVRSEEELP